MPDSDTTLAILGGGQLARMLAIAAKPLGVSCRVLDPAESPSAASIVEHIRAAYDDQDGLRRLIKGSFVVTYEWENVPADTVRLLNKTLTVHPSPWLLCIAQDRHLERKLFAELCIPLPKTDAINSLDELSDAFEQGFPAPALLKSRRMGYDGKGQFLITSPKDAPAAWEAIGGVPAVLDSFVDYVRELSIIACRGQSGQIVFYPLTQNTHRGGILRLSLAPAPSVPEGLEQLAREYISSIMEGFGYVGVLALELFQVCQGADAQLVANEIAPRVHNSGHWTIEGAQTSQFENHVRAVLGLPLGSTEMKPEAPFAAMINAIGSLPRVEAVTATPGATLHDYEKAPRPGRKVGHTTIVAESEDELRARLERFTRIVG